jgi:hypothetical protein
MGARFLCNRLVVSKLRVERGSFSMYLADKYLRCCGSKDNVFGAIGGYMSALSPE